MENRKAQISSGPKQREVMVCLKFVASKLLLFLLTDTVTRLSLSEACTLGGRS